MLENRQFPELNSNASDEATGSEMNLHKRLAEIRQAFETGDTPRETVEVLNRNIEKLLEAGVSSEALKVGDQAPLNLAVQTSTGAVPLNRFFNGKFLVLTWFRGNW